MSFYPTAFPQNISDESTASVCLAMLARHGPRLMRQGGGQLMKEVDPEISEEERAKIIELRRQGLTWPEIASAVHRSRSTIRKILKLAGLIKGKK